MKRYLSAILILCMVISVIPVTAPPVLAAESTETEAQETVTAPETQEESLWEYETYSEGIVLTAYNGTATDVYVPSAMEEHTVVKLSDGLFRDNDSLNSVTLGTGISEIGSQCFYDCDNLVCIVTNEELTTIGTEAFYSCDVFNSIVLYDAVTTIGENAFSDCPSMTVWCNESTTAHTYATENSIAYEILNPDATPETYVQDGITYYIMNGEAIAIDCDNTLTTATVPVVIEGFPVTEIRGAFESCTSLQSVILPVGLKTIGDNAFYSCAKLSAIEIPESVSAIGEKALSGCKNITHLVVPDSVVSIGEGAFTHCQSLVSAVLPKYLVSIPKNLFYYCLKLETVVFPENLQVIGWLSFNYCNSLTQVILPEGLLTVEGNAFKHCSNLQELYIPDSVTTIAAYAFDECPVLRTVKVPASVTSMTATSFAGTTLLQVVQDSFAHTFCVDNDLLYFIYNGSNTPEIYTVDDVSYYIMDGEAVAYRREAEVKTITMPETVGGYPVTQIRYAFKECSNLTAITLPECLEYIADNAFYNCRALTSIDIPDSVTEIETEAFRYCTKLEEVKLPTKLSEISDRLFNECTSLQTVNIPDTVTEIGVSAFSRCKSLQTINIPESVTTIKESAFASTAIVSCVLPDSVVELGASVFGGCSQLKDVVFPDSITEIKGTMFSGCTSLESFAVPDGVTKIAGYAFYNCTSLASISFPDTLQKIEAGAFYNCKSLYIATIPESVTSIWVNPFPDTMIWVVNENSYAHEHAVEMGVMYFLYSENESPQVYKLDGVYYYVQNGEAIAYRCDSGLVSVIIPEYINVYPVTTLNATFMDCDSLQSVILPEGLTTIDNDAFYQCTALESVNIPSTVKRIGASAFYWCSEITELDLPEGLEVLGQCALAYTGLVEITIPSTLISWNASSFSGCKSLKNVVVCDGVTMLPNSAFYECAALEQIILPDSLVTIERHAFQGCISLAQIMIPDAVTNIGYSAFSGCGALKEITIPEGCTIIAQSMLSGCTSLESIVFTSEVTDIKTGAFSNCISLKSIHIPNTVTSIGSNAFSSCDSLKTVVLPSSLSEMYSNSFYANTIMLVYENSYAHTFAVNNNLLYFVIRKTENPEISYGAGIAGTATYTDGTAAGGATVEILYDDGAVKETVTTDATGAYAFTYAEVGRYTVRVTDTAGNSASTLISIKRMNAFDVFLAGDTNLTLKKGWSVSGTVSDGAATVTVTDENGNVLDSVETTDGSFCFTDIPNGSYIIKVETENGITTQEITVFDGAVSDILLTVATENVTIWGYVEVEDREYNHHRRNWVQVDIYNADGIVVAQTKSDKEGVYRFEKLPVGQYSIVAETAEMRPDKHHHYTRSHTLTGYAYVDAAAAGEYQADDIVLYEENDSLATISDKVTANGEDQACRVILRNVFRHELAQQTTGKNGKYSFTNIRDGLYFVTAVTESDGMGYTVVAVRRGKVYGETDITVRKADKIKEREDRFHQEFDGCNDHESALKYKDRIVEEKRFYDGLSEKEKKQLSKEYVDHLNQMCEWIAECEYVTDEGVTVEHGGLVISGDELENADTVSFEINVEKTDAWTANTEGVQEGKDFIYHDMHDKAGNGEIKQYYEISMSKTVDGHTKQITSVTKDTNATGKFRITMEIPEEYRGHKHYTMLHVHNGETVILADLDDNPNTITFEVERFSTFALTGTDEILVPVVNAEIWQDNQLYGNYATLEEAVNSFDSATQYVKLSQDANITLSLTQNLYIDLNGYDLTGTIITNGYRIYGMDSTTNGYTCENMGYFNCIDAEGNAIAPEKLVKTTAEMTGNVLRYMSIQTETGYTFHRFYLGITHIALVPAATGFGYKAEFYGDPLVQEQVTSIGYGLWLTENHVISRSLAGFKSTLTLRLKEVDVANYGEVPVNAKVTMTLADGTQIESVTQTWTLRQAVEAVNENYSSFTTAQLAAVGAMIVNNPIMQTWLVDNIYKEA